MSKVGVTGSDTPVRAFRRRHGLTQVELADLLEVGDRTIQDWDRQAKPTRVVVLALAALDVELSNKGRE